VLQLNYHYIPSYLRVPYTLIQMVAAIWFIRHTPVNSEVYTLWYMFRCKLPGIMICHIQDTYSCTATIWHWNMSLDTYPRTCNLHYDTCITMRINVYADLCTRITIIEILHKIQWNAPKLWGNETEHSILRPIKDVNQ
jgi:hypothetical protein